jgi:hypothetical protein
MRTTLFIYGQPEMMPIFGYGNGMTLVPKGKTYTYVSMYMQE